MRDANIVDLTRVDRRSYRRSTRDRLGWHGFPASRHSAGSGGGAMTAIRPAAVAGTWYPGSARDLADAVDRYLARAEESEATGHGASARRSWPSVVALIAPHAGLIYSGPVAAHAYGRLRARAPEI